MKMMKTNIKPLLDYLDEILPTAKCELLYSKDYELVIAVMLSAQTTDKSVNAVTPILFKKYPTLAALYDAPLEDIEEIIKPIGSLPDEEIDKESDVTVHTDGRTYQVKAGTQIRLTPGESISIQPYLYHDFEVEKGTGAVLLGEVSQVNDDNTDNRFNPPVGRFPEIEEDEPPYRLLCNEYPPAE